MDGESCGVCGGDGRIANSFGGSTTTCPACRGSGRRADPSEGFHDVTKTKPSHHRAPASTPEAQKWPTTVEGAQLAADVRDGASIPAATKAKLITEIIDHESTHGRCTKTFLTKMRKQVRGTAAH